MGRRRGPKHPQFDASDDLLDARVEGRLDLHGHVAIETPSAVRSFLDRWRRRKPGAIVHIITGKGKGSRWALDDSEGGYKVQVR